MNTKEITVHIIGKTQIVSENVANWLTDMGVSYNYDTSATQADNLIGLAGKRCYMSFDVGDTVVQDDH